MMVVLCVARQLLPGPQVHRAVQQLKAAVTAGELEPNQPYAYYINALEERYRL